MLLWFLLLFPQEETKTAHYDLRIETLDAADVGRMLESLHAHLTTHFGTAPKGRLRMEIYATREGYAAALRRDRQAVLGDAGGCYAPETRKAYLYVQPSDFATRRLILCEGTHQFHLLAAAGNRPPAAGWYTEGLADYFGMHDWDGKTLRTGIVPSVSLEDLPDQAVRNLEKLQWNLKGIADGSVPVDRPEAWALVHYLIHNHPRNFAALGRILDRGSQGATAWKTALGTVTTDLTKRFRAWLEDHAQPWRIVWTGWQQRGEAIEGRSETNGIVVLKRSPESLRAEMEVVEGLMKAGLVFGFRSADDFWLAQIVGERQVRVLHRANGEWAILAEKTVVAAVGQPSLRLTRTASGIRITANGEVVGEFEAEGDFGLNVEACRVYFRMR